MPSSWVISKRLCLQVGNGAFWIPFASTFAKIALAFLIVTLSSLFLGYFFAVHKKLYTYLRPFWDFMRSIPPATLFPIFLIIFGLGDLTKVVIGIYFATLILTLNIADSFQSALDKKNEVWKNMNIKKRDIFRFYLLPQIISYMVSGLRVTGSLIVALIVIAEMYVGSQSGIGGAIVNARDNYKWPDLYVLILVTGFMGYIINQIIDNIYEQRRI